MTIAKTVEGYLAERGLDYDLIKHPHTGSSHETAEAAHLPEDHIAKAVVVSDEAGYLVVVVPASNWLKMDALREELKRDLHLATEDQIEALFNDCDPGAVPPLGLAYGIETLMDESLSSLAEVYFESGDHEQLVHMKGDDFLALLSGTRRGYFSHEH